MFIKMREKTKQTITHNTYNMIIQAKNNLGKHYITAFKTLK